MQYLVQMLVTMISWLMEEAGDGLDGRSAVF